MNESLWSHEAYIKAFHLFLHWTSEKKLKSGQIEDQKRNTDQQETASAPHLGVKREMEEN